MSAPSSLYFVGGGGVEGDSKGGAQCQQLGSACTGRRQLEKQFYGGGGTTPQSMNRMSVSASATADARHNASSRDSAWRASERASIRMSAPSSLLECLLPHPCWNVCCLIPVRMSAPSSLLECLLPHPC
jgi:hypothetical protein